MIQELAPDKFLVNCPESVIDAVNEAGGYRWMRENMKNKYTARQSRMDNYEIIFESSDDATMFVLVWL
jgi:hypothetical protein